MREVGEARGAQLHSREPEDIHSRAMEGQENNEKWKSLQYCRKEKVIPFILSNYST
jgi:hypothetical protein